MQVNEMCDRVAYRFVALDLIEDHLRAGWCLAVFPMPAGVATAMLMWLCKCKMGECRYAKTRQVAIEFSGRNEAAQC